MKTRRNGPHVRHHKPSEALLRAQIILTCAAKGMDESSINFLKALMDNGISPTKLISIIHDMKPTNKEEKQSGE